MRVIPRPNARTDATLLAWTVPVVQLDAGAALAAIGKPIADIRYGASVGYLAELAAFACELVERGRVLPELRRDTRGAIACWRPVLQGRDVVAMTRSAKAPAVGPATGAQAGRELREDPAGPADRQPRRGHATPPTRRSRSATTRSTRGARRQAR